MKIVFLLLAAVVAPVIVAFAGSKHCSGNARYDVTFYNFLVPEDFENMIPEGGLAFSPLTAVTHSNRISILTVRGFATDEVKLIAERGDSTQLRKFALAAMASGLVKDLKPALEPTMPGNSTTLPVKVSCDNSFLTVLGMIAPSPDWIVQVSNLNLFDSSFGSYIKYKWGHLIAYDAGTDSGGDFTPPGDTSLDMPTVPTLNIAPLVEDATDPFNGRIIGKFVIKKIN